MPDETKAGFAVIVNGSGGRAKREGALLGPRLTAAFAQHGVSIEPRIVSGAELEQAIKDAPSSACVVVGGGDGTLGTAAHAVSQGGQTMALLPLGTLNHLSLDLQIPADLDQAAAIAVHGATETIDLGEVNGVTFVNNASIGLYARMVRSRDARALPKWLATFPAAWTALKALKRRSIEVEADGRRRRIVGNNHYAIGGAERGHRASLTDGKLSVYAVRERSAGGLLLFALRALIGRADPARDFIGIADLSELTVLGEGAIAVAHNGEVRTLSLPLRFRVRPAALRIKVPTGPRM